VPATVIVGAQWGDEGKGKIVDLLARDSDLVCRYNGGPNAGHTVVVGGETYKLHHLPSGILDPGTDCVIGAGCVVDPEVLIEELDELESRGVSTERVYVSGNAHVIMPWHRLIDQASEGSASGGSGRRAAASGRPTPTRRSGSAFASRTSSTRRYCARRSSSRSRRRTCGCSRCTARSRWSWRRSRSGSRATLDGCGR
jgi:adenylosuccinate synthase